MDLRVDRCGWPVVELRPRRYIHLYPVTVYHIERYAWSLAGFAPEIAGVLDDRERTPARHVGPAAAAEIIAVGLSWQTAEAVASWLGGRLPCRAEHLAAAASWQQRPELDADAVLPGEDGRLPAIASRLLSAGVRRERLLPDRYGDLVSEFSEPPYGDRWVLHHPQGMTRIAAERGLQVPLEGAGLSAVFDERDVLPITTGTVPRGRGAR
jgi:hypothetical protein